MAENLGAVARSAGEKSAREIDMASAARSDMSNVNLFCRMIKKAEETAQAAL